MAHVLILGGGFGGVVAAELLAKNLGPEHQLTLVSRSSRFVFYPALVRLAFGQAQIEGISSDLRGAMLDRRVRFVEAEVARVDPEARRVVLASGEVAGELSYDYLIFALGRRLATERVTGFYEYAHHLLSVEAAIKFGAAVRAFKEGRAVIGSCPGARLPIPVYETAFALARSLKEQGLSERTRIRVVSPLSTQDELGGEKLSAALKIAFDEHEIEFLSDFSVQRITEDRIETSGGQGLSYDLLMLLPPFVGPSAVIGTGITGDDGYLNVDHHLRVEGVERMYAAGDCVNFSGPKLGHMAVRQGEVAAANTLAEIENREPAATYEHEMMSVIDEGGHGSIYLHQNFWQEDQEPSIRRGRFWSWAKLMQEKYWRHQHS